MKVLVLSVVLLAAVSSTWAFADGEEPSEADQQMMMDCLDKNKPNMAEMQALSEKKIQDAAKLSPKMKNFYLCVMTTSGMMAADATVNEDVAREKLTEPEFNKFMDCAAKAPASTDPALTASQVMMCADK